MVTFGVLEDGIVFLIVYWSIFFFIFFLYLSITYSRYRGQTKLYYKRDNTDTSINAYKLPMALLYRAQGRLRLCMNRYYVFNTLLFFYSLFPTLTSLCFSWTYPLLARLVTIFHPFHTWSSKSGNTHPCTLVFKLIHPTRC